MTTESNAENQLIADNAQNDNFAGQPLRPDQLESFSNQGTGNVFSMINDLTFARFFGLNILGVMGLAILYTLLQTFSGAGIANAASLPFYISSAGVVFGIPVLVGAALTKGSRLSLKNYAIAAYATGVLVEISILVLVNLSLDYSNTAFGLAVWSGTIAAVIGISTSVITSILKPR